MKRDRHDYDITTGEGQKRLFYEVMGHDITKAPERPDYYEPGEYGSDPILDDDGNITGFVKMVPTGRVVDLRKGRP
jgi:hypothetical protein